MKLSKLFITGCDSNTQWMLPWFVDNFKQHNPNAELVIMDFGMEGGGFEHMRKSIRSQDAGWFKKPKAMLTASLMADYVCWIDTDCHIRDNIEGIFDHLEPNKLAMVEDVPWSTRRGEKWHNSGVVAFRSSPNILSEWATACAFTSLPGDQEVLHELVKTGMRRLIHITDLPREYNTLRLDIQDGTAPANIKVMHWTGQKGKQEIKRLME